VPVGGVTAGAVEEVAFRGYMQRGLERHDRENALWITSLVFVASMLDGTLARRTGTILPGMAIHVAGDLARVYFGVLGGDGRLLVVG